MPKSIERDEVRDLADHEQAQIVEVLPREEYEWAHLAGAVNLPLKDLDGQSAAALDRGRPVIVYCNDFQRDMRPRAAWRLERLGFQGNALGLHPTPASRTSCSSGSPPCDPARTYRD